jgi:hypothetical protein
MITTERGSTVAPDAAEEIQCIDWNGSASSTESGT